MNTAEKDIYIISAIKLAKPEFDLNSLQSLDVIEIEDEDDIMGSSVHDRVDTISVLLDDIDPNRVTNTQVVAVVFRHFHRQQRPDNYGIRVYIKC